MDETNPKLKGSFIEVVENQIRDNDPPEAKETFERLISDGVSEEDAKIYIGQAICVEIWDTMKNKKEFNSQRYVRNLKRLPAEPSE
jgi:hypothetical protein